MIRVDDKTIRFTGRLITELFMRLAVTRWTFHHRLLPVMYHTPCLHSVFDR